MSVPAPPPLRVALALESSGPGGAEQMLLQLADELRRRGAEVVVVTLRPGWMTGRAERAGHPVWIVPQRRGLDPLWIPRFAARLRRERIDVLHSHEFAMNVYGGAAARLAGLGTVATLHGKQWATGHPRRALAYRVLRRLGMRVVAVSHDLARFLEAGLGLAGGALAVVHNGIPIAQHGTRDASRRSLRRELGLAEDALLALAVGNLYPVKDHASLVRAVAGCPGLAVAIAGRGEEETRLRALARELGVAERVHLLGLRDDVPELLAAADLFVHPSRSEGLPLAVLEAMAAGLPVVASRVGGIPEAVEDGVTGLLVPPEDPDALAAALGTLASDPPRRAALARAGRTRAEAEFSLAAMGGAYLALYDEVRARPRLRARASASS